MRPKTTRRCLRGARFAIFVILRDSVLTGRGSNRVRRSESVSTFGCSRSRRSPLENHQPRRSRFWNIWTIRQHRARYCSRHCSPADRLVICDQAGRSRAGGKGESETERGSELIPDRRSRTEQRGSREWRRGVGRDSDGFVESYLARRERRTDDSLQKLDKSLRSVSSPTTCLRASPNHSSHPIGEHPAPPDSYTR